MYFKRKCPIYLYWVLCLDLFVLSYLLFASLCFVLFCFYYCFVIIAIVVTLVVVAILLVKQIIIIIIITTMQEQVPHTVQANMVHSNRIYMYIHWLAACIIPLSTMIARGPTFAPSHV